MNQLEFDIKVTAGDLYDYMLRHTYHTGQGLLGTCIGAFAIILALNKQAPLYFILGIVVVLYIPWTLFIKSGQQARLNPAFQKPLHFTLNDEGIVVSQDDVNECQKWQDMYKAVATSRSVIVYTNRKNACIFPRKQLAEKEEQVIAFISAHMNPKKVNIRY